MEEPPGEEENQDGLSAQSAGQAPLSSASSLPKVSHELPVSINYSAYLYRKLP